MKINDAFLYDAGPVGKKIKCSDEEGRFGKVSDLCLATHDCVALGQSPQLSVPQFLHWKIGIINNTYFMKTK